MYWTEVLTCFANLSQMVVTIIEYIFVCKVDQYIEVFRGNKILYGTFDIHLLSTLVSLVDLEKPTVNDCSYGFVSNNCYLAFVIKYKNNSCRAVYLLC